MDQGYGANVGRMWHARAEELRIYGSLSLTTPAKSDSCLYVRVCVRRPFRVFSQYSHSCLLTYPGLIVFYLTMKSQTFLVAVVAAWQSTAMGKEIPNPVRSERYDSGEVHEGIMALKHVSIVTSLVHIPVSKSS